MERKHSSHFAADSVIEAKIRFNERNVLHTRTEKDSPEFNGILILCVRGQFDSLTGMKFNSLNRCLSDRLASSISYTQAWRIRPRTGKDPEVKWIVFKSTRGCHNSCGYYVTYIIRNPHWVFVLAPRQGHFSLLGKIPATSPEKILHLERPSLWVV